MGETTKRDVNYFAALKYEDCQNIQIVGTSKEAFLVNQNLNQGFQKQTPPNKYHFLTQRSPHLEEVYYIDKLR